jgi:hypothetical protein
MYSAIDEANVQAETTLVDHRQELHNYLNSPREDTLGGTKALDLVAWWGVGHVVMALILADADPPYFPPFRNTPATIQLSPVWLATTFLSKV